MNDLRPFSFDPSTLGFFRIIDWNPNRQLRININQVHIADKQPHQDWVDAVSFQAYLDEARQMQGHPRPTLVDYEVDTRGIGNKRLELQVAQSSYFEYEAARRYLWDHSNAYDALISRINNSDLRSIIRSAPNSNITMNVTVQSRDGRVMMIQRPAATRVWRSFYQAGTLESMEWSIPGQPIETCYELATRALREIGLYDPEDYYNNIVFSWFGFCAMDAAAYFFAHVRTCLEEDELVQRVGGGIPLGESAIEWYALDRQTIASVLATWNDGPRQPRYDKQGRRYLPHVVLSLTQLWRITNQGMLIPPTR